MNEELKELVEEMQEFLHKGNKLVNKAKKHLGMPMNGMGQRNFPHDLPPAFPQSERLTVCLLRKRAFPQNPSGQKEAGRAPPPASSYVSLG